MMNYTNIGAKIRALRKKEGMTLEQLALALNIKKNMLSNYELGKSAISAQLLTNIADYFGTSLDYLTNRASVIKLNETTNDNNLVEVPVYTYLRSSNVNDETNLNDYLYSLKLPYTHLYNGKYFGILITDDSVNRCFPRGSIAIVREQSVAKPGDIIVYTYDNNVAHYGIYHISGENIVISAHSYDDSFSPAIFPLSDKKFHILGKISMIFSEVNV